MIEIYKKTIVVESSSIDVMGHVNNKEYLKWMEEAALEHSTELGWPTERYLRSGGAFVARAHWIEYLRPTFLGETLVMHTWVENMRGKTSLRRFYLTRNSKICMRGATQWAFIQIASGRAIEVFPEVASSFPVIELDNPILQSLGFRVGPVGKLVE